MRKEGYLELLILNQYQFLNQSNRSMTKKIWSLIPLFLFAINVSFAADGYKITVKLDNYDKDTLLLGYHYGEKQYIKDTVITIYKRYGYSQFRRPFCI